MRSDKGFFDFLKGGSIARLLPIFVIGMLLLIVGSGILSGSDKSEPAASVSSEGELSELCSAIDGVGRCKVMMTEDSKGQIIAVAVLCDGAESARVRASITELISSLYSIRSSRIAILKYSG